MAFALRVRSGPNNKRILDNLEEDSFDRAVITGNVQFSLLLKRTLVVKTHSLTRTRTGTMARSWNPQPTGNRIVTTNTARTVDKKSYPKFIEFGTKSHFVGPKPGRKGKGGKPAALAWRRDGGGPTSAARSGFNPKKFFFSKGHRVRGIRPRRIFRRALDTIKDELGKMIEVALRKELEP